MSDYIALGSLIISVIAIIISIITNTKKYELTGTQRAEILDWYYKVTENLISLRLYISQNKDFDKERYLSELSALIELGRFYFPNINNKSGYGNEKSSAYRGLRDVTLEFLVYSFDICQKNNASEYIAHLEQLQKLFTSRVYDMLEPQKYRKMIKKNTKLSVDDGISLVEFLSTDPSKSNYFYQYMK